MSFNIPLFLDSLKIMGLGMIGIDVYKRQIFIVSQKSIGFLAVL